MILIAFGGKAGSGKSTSADYLVKHHNFIELSFAKPLKDLVQNTFQIDEKYLYDQNYKNSIIEELQVSGRQLLQIIGTELFRKDIHKYLPNLRLNGDSIWVHNMHKNIQKLLKDGKTRIVISDKRFKNEYDNLKLMGFIVYDIERDEEKKENDSHKINNHESEMRSPCDLIIQNEGTKEELFLKLDNIIIENNLKEIKK
jgi:hypothetical protein